MARQTKSESKLSEAADRTAALLQGLQSRLREAPPAVDSPRVEVSEDLDRELQAYFGSGSRKAAENGVPGVPDQIRDRVIEAVADRILECWERGHRSELGALENQVIDRVAERILERMTKR
jgi:hypothetical protein